MIALTIDAILGFLYYSAMAIGALIQSWRLSKNTSLESLSDMAGLPTVLLEQIESELVDPTTHTIQSLARALHIPAAWLFESPCSFESLFKDSEGQEQPAPSQIDPVTDRILAGSRVERSLYVLLTALVQAGDPKLLRAAEMSLRSLMRQSRQASVPWQERAPGHFEPPSD